MPYTHGVRHAHHHNVKRHSHTEPAAIPQNDQPYPTVIEPPSVVRRAESSSSTCSSSDSNCGTSKSSAMTTTLPVVLGAVIPIVCAIIVLIFLHRRHVRKLRAEDANDKYKSMDFGMEAVKAGGKPGGNPEMGEKPHKRGGMSLDIGNSPYLLPPGLHNSKESLRSLSKVISSDDDKYRLAANSDNASLRSYPTHPKWGYDDTSSVGGSTKHLPVDDMNHGLLQNASRMSRSSPPKGSPTPDIANHSRNFDPEKTSLSDASVVDAHLDMPKDNKLPEFPHGEHDAGSKRLSMADTGFGGFNFGTDAHEIPQHHDDLPTIRESPSDSHVAPSAPRISLPLSDAASDYGDDVKLDQFPSVNVSHAEEKPKEAEDVPPASNRVTQSFTRFDEGFDPHRLTVGIRPLPPEDPADNAEQRANRIRSFYKEYFDDTKGGAPAPGGHEEYYEDFGPEFYDDPGVYDPSSYAGEYMTGPSKPFAQPMGRRAMTPPPRFQGPPRTMHSSAGFRSPGPRAFSSASGRLPGRGPPKPLPPPEPLHVLPSPSMISDDMSVLPIDYAPGKTFKDQQAGRPESPRGGLRPYTPAMPSRSPLASSFDDLAAIPSPHALRKSGVFMPLGFAPPPRFKNDTSSDAGSVRSNRTGISANHMHNIRAGAYRVSRLPADTVGTRDDISTSLRPKWDIR